MKEENFKQVKKQIEDIELDHGLKDYHAFIFWFIETTFGLSQKNILNSMCDGAHDKGIDAVLINPVEMKVTIIQSKYEREGGQVQINENEIKLFGAVKKYFDSRESLRAAIHKGNQITKRLMNLAFEAVRKKDYILELIFITTHRYAPHIDDLIYETLGFTESQFKIYHYKRILQLYYDKLRDFTPKLGSYNLPFIDADKSIIKINKHKSWVLTVNLQEIRALVNKYEDNLFRKNVRNFLGKSRTNRKILETLNRDPDNFWYYNNGITILCDKAHIVMEKGFVHIENPQVVNGCQTVKSIQKYEGGLDGELMLRVIESTDHDFVNYLTLYQNSSNPVRNRDLKSNDPIQIRLKQEFRRQGYYYEIKRGEEYVKMAKKYPAIKNEFNGYAINNEDIAKFLAAIRLSPASSLSSGSEEFFSDYYDQIFTDKTSTFNCLALYHLYYLIRETYTNKKRFFSFEKAWVFKNRAVSCVLKFIYDAMRGEKYWERDFTIFCESYDDREYEKLYNRMHPIINKYFKLIYKAWDRNEIEYYNTYLQNEKTIQKIKHKFTKDIENLTSQTRLVMAKYGSKRK